MRKFLMIAISATALMAAPSLASADPDAAGNAAAGAAIGAGTGFLIGGPVGAAVGAGVGGTVGAGTAPNRDTVIIDRDRAPAHVRDGNCVRDALGNVSCTESGARSGEDLKRKRTPLLRGFFLCA